MRAQLEKKLAQKEKEKKEEHLRQLAQKAREERAGIRTIVPGTSAPVPGQFAHLIQSSLYFNFAQMEWLSFVSRL